MKTLTQLLVIGILICSSFKSAEACKYTCKNCDGESAARSATNTVDEDTATVAEGASAAVRKIPYNSGFGFGGRSIGTSRLFDAFKPCCPSEKNDIDVTVNVNVCAEADNCNEASAEEIAVVAASGKENEIDFVVQTPEANKVDGALISITYADSGDIVTLVTGRAGNATTMVMGCEVIVQVSADLHQPMQRVIDCCNNPSQTVVLELRPMCNFQVWFQDHEGDGNVYEDQYIDEMSYMYSTSSGESGHGDVVGGYETGPLCIYVAAQEASETLKFRVIGRGGNSVNQLEMTEFDRSDEYASGVNVYGARVTIPAGIFEYDASDIFFTLYLNVWEVESFDGHDNSETYSRVFVVTSDGTTISYSDSYTNYYAVVAKSEVENEEVVGDDLLIGFDMYSGNFNGNAALSDSDGNVTSAEVPRYQFTSGSLDMWYPFCLCKGDTKEVKLVSKEYNLLDNSFDPTDGNMCHFYLMCPCPLHDHDEDHSSLANECTDTDLEEFFCTGGFCDGCAVPSEITNWSTADCTP